MSASHSAATVASTPASTFVGAIRAEFIKLFSTRMWWVLLMIMVAYVGVMAAAMAGLFGSNMGDAGGMPPAEEGQLATLPSLVYSLATSLGYVFPVILGTLAVTGEYRHQTLTPTFLATPKRGRVLLAKLLVLALVGALFGAAALIGTVGIGGPILAATGNDSGLGDTETWMLIARAVLAMALWAVIGVGVGTLIPNQVAAIVVLLAFTQFVEPTLRAAALFADWAADIGRFLPGAAGDALVGASFFSLVSAGATSADPLLWWQGGLVLLAIAVVAALIGYVSAWRKDVT
ncbi:ABC-2 family transporter [Homoserinimonas aerilata]|uniref:ABC-2 family transporter n=1 Tax=Homoserinimonas aerilata TaxID=1162970 RepID=A0A542YKE3_9MICO|nr:ABC transporter permease [Homoserinimonas aerilata]TQL48545.1 ABC-2 family transporter [Homoserinimonas aerilata]